MNECSGQLHIDDELLPYQTTEHIPTRSLLNATFRKFLNAFASKVVDALPDFSMAKSAAFVGIFLTCL